MANRPALPGLFFLTVCLAQASEFHSDTPPGLRSIIFEGNSGAFNLPISNHGIHHKILLTKLLTLLILPLEDSFISFCRTPREMTMDPEVPAEKSNGTLRRKGEMAPPFEVPKDLCTRI